MDNCDVCGGSLDGSDVVVRHSGLLVHWEELESMDFVFNPDTLKMDTVIRRPGKHTRHLKCHLAHEYDFHYSLAKRHNWPLPEPEAFMRERHAEIESHATACPSCGKTVLRTSPCYSHYCSRWCYYTRRRKPLHTQSCWSCGTSFKSKRIDACYCSPRCRKRGQRARKTS